MPVLPPQFSIGLSIDEAAGTNAPHISSFHNRSCLQESWQVIQAPVAEKYSNPVNLWGWNYVYLFMETGYWENVQ